MYVFHIGQFTRTVDTTRPFKMLENLVFKCIHNKITIYNYNYKLPLHA
jgi:hypothetical protein